MKLIESKTLGTAAASIEFTSIPQDGTDLLVLISARSDTNTGSKALYVAFNGSSSNFTTRSLVGSGSASSSSTSSTGYVGQNTQGGDTANTFSNASLYVPNYTAATNKSYSSDAVTENNATAAWAIFTAGLWSQTAAITSLRISSDSDLVTGSTISLYKITKGSDGIVTTS
jgi:hypothetical protein